MIASFTDFQPGDWVKVRAVEGVSPYGSGGSSSFIGEIVKSLRVNIVIRTSFWGYDCLHLVRKTNVCAVARREQVIWREEAAP